MFWRRERRSRGTGQQAPATPQRLDVPVYLDAGVALSLSATLGRGLVMESSVERAVTDGSTTATGARAAVPHIVSARTELGESRSVAVTESEVRKQTQESIFNTARDALEDRGLVGSPSAWAEFHWRVGAFVDVRTERIVVPLVSALARVRVIAESVSFVTSELSTDALEQRIPQVLNQLRAAADQESETTSTPRDDPDLDAVLSWMSEIGELARAASGLISRLEAEAEASGLVDVVMFERRAELPSLVVVASLDRDYVDTKLIRRLGQSNFGVLGKVIRSPDRGTAFNAFRNSMLGATNQFPVLLSRLTQRLQELPLLLGDSVLLGDADDHVVLDFVGSASAIAELSPLWACPSVELFAIAIYA